MKRFVPLLFLVLLVASLTACGGQPTTTSAESNTPTQESSEPSPTPEAKAYVPQDIFSSEFNPYGDIVLPENFILHSASFSSGSAKLEGKSIFTLSMTAGGNMFAAVAYHADVAGLSADEKSNRIGEYLKGGFCEFQGKDGSVITIRKTNPDDNRYEYIDGCLIEIQWFIDTNDIDKFTNLARDNYNITAVSALADFVDIQPDWSEYDIGVNLHIKEAQTSVVYHVSDTGTAQNSIAASVKPDWYDKQNGSMGLSYGIISTKIQFDSKSNAIYVSEYTGDFGAAMSKYVAPEFSLFKLGFGFDQEGVCGVYVEREPNYLNVAIHRPEWGKFNEDWNIEYLNNVNGYGLRITYNVADDKFHISVDKNNVTSGFDYSPSTKKYFGEYPSPDNVKQMFNDAFGTKGDDFYGKPIAHFNKFLKDTFGLSMEELYALPVK